MATTNEATVLLEGFIPYRIPKVNHTDPSIIVRPSTITFNKAAMEALSYSADCRILIKAESKQIAIQATTHDDPNATKFFEHKDGLQDNVRWSSKATVAEFLAVAGMTRDQIDKTGIKFFGTAHPEAQAIIFEMAV